MEENKRRGFLKKLGVTGVAAAVSPMVFAEETKSLHYLKRVNPTINLSTIKIALIGAGGMGTADTETALLNPNIELVAVCDLYDARIESAKEKWGSNIYTTKDYTKILSRKDVDAVIIGTPDHWHKQIGIDALNAGKHVYCEKPLSHTIKEGRAMVNASKRYNRILQTGSMQRSSSNFLIGCQLVRNGYLGKISQALVNVGNPASVCKLPFEETPDSIDWDKWLGSAQLRPYNKALISKIS